jgi:type IV secretory pathway VirJ component
MRKIMVRKQPMHLRHSGLQVVLAAAVLSPAWAFPARAQRPCSDAVVASMPLIERPATSDTNNTLVVLLTGDGGWAGADEKVATGLRARGAAVIGVNMRSYLGRRRTPDETASDIACVTHTFLERWHRARIMLLGYSRGADIAPFVASRWPTELRDRLNMVALVSLSQRANFQFHLIDLVKDVKRDDDVPVAPELDKLRGLRVICIYGSGESDSGCSDADPAVVTKYERGGGHRLTGGFDVMAEILEQGLRPPA